MTQNRRSAFRIEEAVRLQVEKISDQEWEDRLAANVGSMSSSYGIQSAVEDLQFQISHKLIELKRVSTTAASCIELLNKKVDILLEGMRQMYVRETDVHSSPLMICELSATGIRFTTKEKLAVDEKVYLRFVIIADSSYFETLGRVARVSAGDTPEDTVVGVEFFGVRDSDRDLLIRHLLSRQSETIRVQKGSSDTEEEFPTGVYPAAS